MRIKWWGEANDGCILRCVRGGLPSSRRAPVTLIRTLTLIPNANKHLTLTLFALRPTDAAEPALDATATYHINCSREQLAKYLNDMRVLVIDLISEAPEGPALAHVHGHAYLHLAMLSFDQLCSLELSVYDEYSLEIARVRVNVHIDFSPVTLLRASKSGSSRAEENSAAVRASWQGSSGSEQENPQSSSRCRGRGEGGIAPTWVGDSLRLDSVSNPSEPNRARRGER